MCCSNEPSRVREILKKFSPDDFLIGYKIYCFSKLGKHKIHSPYYQHELSLGDLVSGVVKSDAWNAKPCLNYNSIYNGIHFYKEERNAKYYCQGETEIRYIKIYAQVKDLIGVGDIDAVFSKIYLDRDSVLEALKSRGMYK